MEGGEVVVKDSSMDALCLELYEELPENQADLVTHWARVAPDRTALIEHDTGETVTWRAFDRAVSAFAAILLSLGLRLSVSVAAARSWSGPVRSRRPLTAPRRPCPSPPSP